MTAKSPLGGLSSKKRKERLLIAGAKLTVEQVLDSRLRAGELLRQSVHMAGRCCTAD